MKLRYYQQEAHDAAIDWLDSNEEPAVIEAATGGGKSHIISALAATYKRKGRRGHIVCLAPSAELVVQNHSKYTATGSSASIYSSSAGSKCLLHNVVFATPITFLNGLKHFGKVDLVIVDEAHGTTNTVREIISKCGHPPVIGLTATPYVLGKGYIFARDVNDKLVAATDPYYRKQIYCIQGRELTDAGYLSRPLIGTINKHAGKYETTSFEPDRYGKVKDAVLDRAFVGKGRLTASIIADVVAQSKDRKGVLVYAQTIQHAYECMESLPRGLSEIITGKTAKSVRADIISRFKNQQIKYLVNVGVLTTGFDAPHADVIAILRYTESAALLQQIIGRGSRLCEGKDNFLILDYAQNIDRHCPSGDIYSPEISSGPASKSEKISIECDTCHAQQTVSIDSDIVCGSINRYGHALDITGAVIMTPDRRPMLAHNGRKCNGCQKYFVWKDCTSCGGQNDIAAKYCQHCKHEIINPNDNLVSHVVIGEEETTEKVLSWEVDKDYIAKSGRACVKIDYNTPTSQITAYYQSFNSGKAKAATKGFNVRPATITYKLRPGTGFFDIVDYNREIEEYGGGDSMAKDVWGSDVWGSQL